jgi:hypothetical protein
MLNDTVIYLFIKENSSNKELRRSPAASMVIGVI